MLSAPFGWTNSDWSAGRSTFEEADQSYNCYSNSPILCFVPYITEMIYMSQHTVVPISVLFDRLALMLCLEHTVLRLILMP